MYFCIGVNFSDIVCSSDNDPEIGCNRLIPEVSVNEYAAEFAM